MQINTDVLKKIKSGMWNASEAYKASCKAAGKPEQFFNAYDVIGAHTQEFNAVQVATDIVKKADPNSKYFGMSVEQIVNQWNDKGDASRSSGNRLDSYVEALFNKQEVPQLITEGLTPVQIERDINLRKSADQAYALFLSSPHVQLIGTELWICGANGFRGKTDILLWNDYTGTVLVLDNKQNEDITYTNSYGKFMRGALEMFPECDINKMACQLFAYKYNIEKHTDLKVGATSIIHYTEKGFTMPRPKMKYDVSLMEKVFEHTIKTKYATKK